MKIKKILMIIGIISIILINRTIEVYAWVSKGTYEACNIINMCISDFLKFMVFFIGISFVTLTIKYIKNSKTEQKQKAKKILKWLIITIIQIAILLIGAVGALEIGMETYWTTGERYQINEIEEAGLKLNEDEDLEEKRKIMQYSEKINDSLRTS